MHRHHGGNVQVMTAAADGWPLWTSDVRAGREQAAEPAARSAVPG
jgi:hypothetical protein